MNIDRFRGLIVASPTPFDSSRNVDEDGTGKLMHYFVDCGINGIFLLSSTGEYFSMTQEKREHFLDAAIAAVGGRVPLMAMVSDACLDAVLNNIDRVAGKKIDAVVVTPPYYYKYSQSELYEFFRIIADKSPLPVLLYNQPMRLPNNIEPELVQSLSSHGNIIGLKDTSSDAVRLLKLLNMFKDRKDFLVYAGSEGLAAYAALFGGNFVYALAAVQPELFQEILQKGRQKDTEGVMVLQARINKLFGLFDAVKGGYKDSFSNFTHCIKAFLKLKGICEPYNSQLGFSVDDADFEKVGRFLQV